MNETAFATRRGHATFLIAFKIMPAFTYTARRITGQLESGTLVAATRQEVLRLLSAQSLLPVRLNESVGSLHPSSSLVSNLRGSRIPAAAKGAMFDQLSDLLESGVPLLKSLDVLCEQTSHGALKSKLLDLRQQVANGRTLADAMRSHREAFNDLAVSLVHAGEEGGFLEDSLQRVARFTEKQEELRGRVAGALAYPLFLIGVGTIVVVGMMVFFVPKFAPLFERLRARGELPSATVVLLGASDLLRHHGLWLLAALAIGAFFARQSLQTDAACEWLDRVKLRLRGLGPIIRHLALARFCRVLGTLLKNGVPLLKSLRIAKDATGNRVLNRAIQLAADNVSSGKSLAEPLRTSGQFPRELLEMIAVGETANRLDTVLVELADKLDQRTQRKIDTLVKLLEPCLMLVMAVVIGFLVVALLMPVFESNGL